MSSSVHQRGGSDPDFRRTLQVVRLRWRILVSLIVVGAGLAALNDLNLFSGDDAAEVVVERFFEAPTEVSELGIARVDPVLLVPRPSADAQLAILRGADVLNEVTRGNSSDATLEINYSSPKFTIVDSLDEVNNRVSFLSTGHPSFSYTCISTSIVECDRLIDAYVSKTEIVRRDATRAGLKGSLDLLQSLIEQSEMRLGDASYSSEERTAESELLVSLRSSNAAISIAYEQITGRLIQTSRTERLLVPENQSIQISSVGFGGLVGLIIGLLLVLQLGVIDDRIRFASDIPTLGDNFEVIGSSNGRKDLLQVASVTSVLSNETLQDLSDPVVIPFGKKSCDFSDSLKQVMPSLYVIRNVDEEHIEALVRKNSKFALLIIELGVTRKREILELVGLASLRSVRCGVVLV